MDIDSLKLKKFCECSGWTTDAVYQKIKKGQWIDGREYSKAPDGNIVVSIRGYEAWVSSSRAKVPASLKL